MNDALWATMLIKKPDDEMMKKTCSWETKIFNADGRMHARIPPQVQSFKIP